MFHFYDRFLFRFAIVIVIIAHIWGYYAGQKCETISPIRSGCTLEKGKQENRRPSEHRSSVFTRHAQIDT